MSMLSEAGLQALLKPFGLQLDATQLDKISRYLGLLLRWNQKINLTAVRSPEEILTRHFGESLLLRRSVSLQGSLLDIGSGAGFPGLALKITSPDLAVTLLEPVGKKRAFLKEVARACEFDRVEVRPERLAKFIARVPAPEFRTVTMRAVGPLEKLIPEAVRCLAPDGNICVWVTRDQSGKILASSEVNWRAPTAVPLADQREIWIGTRRSVDSEATG